MKKDALMFFAEWGVVLQGFIFLLLCLFVGGDGNFLLTAVSGVSIVVASFILAKIVKQIIRKERPPTKKQLFVPAGRYSFPSGHATGLTAVTLYIASHNGYLGVCAAVVTLVVMTSRVRSGVHFPIDMFGGFVTACISWYLFMPYIHGAVAPFLVGVFR
jgi:undecaprenyl-diphosphatase